MDVATAGTIRTEASFLRLIGVAEPELLDPQDLEPQRDDEPRTARNLAQRAAAARTDLPHPDAIAAQQRSARVVQQTRVTAARVEVRDGRVSVEFVSFEQRTEVATQQSDPLLVDLDGDGFETTGVSEGIDFDIDADGRSDRTSFAAGGDAFLALDRDGDGRITSGAELFGDQHGAADGIAELARFDDTGDGRIDARDAVWDRLRLVDGTGAQRALGDAGVTGIDLGRISATGSTSGGDRYQDAIRFERADGTAALAVDAYLRHR